ncbi:MAG: hypothetical protein LBJ46_08135, partial [Planctomycetota bacterium]|nr:hypothetical protein [Planctomycetota bacterium]
IFDGQGHRIDVDGDRPRQGSGWYAARADGIPSITCVNNRSHVRADWSKSRGHRLSENTRRDLTGVAQAKKTTYQKEAEAERNQALVKLHSMIEKTFVKPTEPTPYLEAKKLPLDPGIYQNKGSTCIPIHDLDGKVYSMAYVQANGTKRYAKNCDKEGHMYILGGVGSLKNAKAFLVGEGYSTVATGAIATAGMGTAGIAAFDSGNLQSVMKTLRERYPDTPIIALGDDDRNLELRDPPLRDQGRYDALRAAEAVANVTTVFPVWSEGIPVDKHHTDFDDLRRINTREGGDGRDGFEAVRSQLAPVIERAIEQTRENRQGQEQVKTRGGRSIA